MLVDAGLAILKRAQSAKDRGLIRDYTPVYLQDDPAVIVYIQIEKNDAFPPSPA